MKLRLVFVVAFLATVAVLTADPRTVAGNAKGPLVAVVSGAGGPVTLSHEGTVVRGWIFPGPYTAAVVLAGPLDTLEWDGDAVVLVAGGKDPSAAAQKALAASKSVRQLVIQPDGAAQVVKAPEEEKEMDYDAASAATEE